MILEALDLLDFRNYKSLSVKFDKNTNIIYGQNAQGKTNILEAIYMSGVSKSHKGSRDAELIRFGCDEGHIKTKVLKNDRTNIVDIHLKKGRKKGIAINRVPIRVASDLFGILHLIFFSPEDLNIIKSSPKLRRRFMDLELCQIDRIYLSDLNKYNKILMQRNQLLKDIYYHPDLRDTLDIWDEQLASCGAGIIERRQKFIEELSPVIKELHYHISGEKERLSVSYEPNVKKEEFERKLFEAREKDEKLKQTTVGPHRDDIRFCIDDVDIRRFGSQGQQRTCALSLKLSEIHLVKNSVSDMPVLLLDDVLSELDSARQNYLLDSLHQTQTIMTCTGLDEFVQNRFSVNKVFEVINGTVLER